MLSAEDSYCYRSFSLLWLAAKHYPQKPALRLDSLRSWIPIRGFLPVVRLIRHVKAEGRVVTVHCVLQHRLARPDRLKEVPEGGKQNVIIVPFKTQAVGARLLPGFGIVFLMPLREIGSLQASGKRA